MVAFPRDPENNRTRTMIQGKTVETAFNYELARQLRRQSPRWRGDVIQAEASETLQNKMMRPDILIFPEIGVPVCIETEWSDSPPHQVENDALKRLAEPLLVSDARVEAVLAVRIDTNLRTANQEKLEKSIKSSNFDFCLFTLNAQNNPVRWPLKGWINGSLSELSDSIEHAMMSETRLADAINELEAVVTQTSTMVRRAADSAPDMLPAMASLLHQEDSEQTTRMAMAIIANAFVEHAALAGMKNPQNGRAVKPLLQCQNPYLLLNEWKQILEINYWPIFNIASELMHAIPSDKVNHAITHSMIKLTGNLLSLGATEMHDMAGQMFQRLIMDRKFLATFYTLPVSAMLLAELAVSRMKIDWRDAKAVTALRVADFASGTGTLISAAYRAIQRQVRRAGSDDVDLHRKMMERSLIAMDIMPAATHLTASILAGSHPQVTFSDTKVMLLPYGEQPDIGTRQIKLGSLDLIVEERARDLFGVASGVRGGGENSKITNVEVGPESCDLVIMNPPFTSPTNHEGNNLGIPVPSFAGFNTTEQEQKAMSKQLKNINAALRRVRSGRMFADGTPLPAIIAGHGNAGLATNFIDLAHEKLAPGGVLALVIPFTFVTGSAWENARQLLETYYKDIIIVSIVDTGSTNRAFSADTNIAEVLVVATRKKDCDQVDETFFANLYRRPLTALEAVTIARRIIAMPRIGLAGTLHFAQDDESTEVGNCITATLSSGSCAGLQSGSLMTAMLSLFHHNKLRLPHFQPDLEIEMTQLNQIGRRGLHHLDIRGEPQAHGGPPRGPFTKSQWPARGYPEYPCLWNHKAKREKCLAVEPDSQVLERPNCRDRSIKLWNKHASRLHINSTFRLTSQPLAACLTPMKTLGGSAWTNFRPHEEAWEPLIAVWANTTLGLMSFWWLGTRQQAGRAMLQVSQQPKLPVLNPNLLSERQIALSNTIFERMRELHFLPANEAYRDEVRKKLDQAVLVELLGLPDVIMESLEILRYQWCLEPSVHGGKSTRPRGRSP